jgi:hypothetical protein
MEAIITKNKKEEFVALSLLLRRQHTTSNRMASEALTYFCVCQRKQPNILFSAHTYSFSVV